VLTENIIGLFDWH